MYWKFGLVVPYLPPANSLLADKLYDKHLKKLKQEGRYSMKRMTTDLLTTESATFILTYTTILLNGVRLCNPPPAAGSAATIFSIASPNCRYSKRGFAMATTPS